MRDVWWGGGRWPVADGDLVLCEWASVSDPREVEGKPVLLTGGDSEDVLTALKLPVRVDGRWMLRSTNPAFADRPVGEGITLRVVAKVLDVVEERRDPVLWGMYHREGIARMFGHENNPSWRTGHRDVTVNAEPHTILMVNLRKPKSTPVQHRYADAFLSPREFQWESQATTTPEGAKGRRVLGHAEEGRTIHLFVRYHTKDGDGRGEPFVYCGPLKVERWEGSAPVRVWFELEEELPGGLWRVWGEL